ncbi:hypothetical protein BJV78DRAFT_1168742 [Lactifluus subvellereus]|nr:hypothetical protein BJV78DRAFT_1168742 [Lactifluus subvellereus]
MVNSYYTVIVGTQPGVYRDWTQAAPKVNEISGAIHKKFKTHAEAWDAFNMAEREGAVRAVRVEPDAVATVSAPLSRISLPRDGRQRPRPQEPRVSQEALGEYAVAQSTGPVTRLGRHSRRNSNGSGSRPTRRGQTSRNVSLQHPTQRIGPVAVGADSRGRCMSESREGLNQGPRNVRAYLDSAGAASTSRETRQTFWGDPGNPGISANHARTYGPLSTLPAADDRANIGLEAHARRDILNPVASPGVQNWGDHSEERRAGGVQSLGQDVSSRSFDLQLQTRTEVGDSLRVPVLSRPPSACSHLSVSSSVSSFDVDFSVQVGSSGFELHRRSESADTPRSVPSPVPSEFSFAMAGLVEGIGPGPSAQSQDDLNEDDSERDATLTILWPYAPDNSRLFGTLRASPSGHVRSPQADLSYPRGDSPPPCRPLSPSLVASPSRTPTHLRTQDIRLSLVGIAASSPRRSPPSPPLPSHVDLEASRSAAATSLGLSLGGDAVSSLRHHPLPRSPAVQASPSSSPAYYRRAGRQSPTGNETYPRNAIPQDQAPPLCLSAAPRDRMQGIVGVELIDGVAPSPHRIPLPLSPAPSARSSSVRSLAQPSHRHRPEMPLYPSLANGGGALLSPSGLDIAFGLPTPALSPIQVPAVIRSPSMDPRSPLSSQTRIPGNFMGLLRVVSLISSQSSLMHSFPETFFSVVLRPLETTMCEHFRDLWGKKNTWNLARGAPV